MIGIYKITSPSGKVYIGQSRNIKKRWKEHRHSSIKYTSALSKSFLKYGIKKHKFEIVCECSIIELNILERYYQDLYQVTNSNIGLNCILTKTEQLPMIINEETRAKISKAGKGRLFTDEHKLNISKSLKGRKFTTEQKNKMRLAKKGKKQSEQAIENAAFPKRKLLLNLETGIYYYGVKEASNSYNINPNTLASYLNKRAKNKTQIIRV